jgi:hypothetical protein
VALVVLRILAFVDDYKAEMVRLGMLTHPEHYLERRKASMKALATGFFVASHLASTHAVEVSETQLPAAALRTLIAATPPFVSHNSCVTYKGKVGPGCTGIDDPGIQFKSHLLEGACRLLATLAKEQASRRRLLLHQACVPG